ncbi:MAG TPA: hypothetical protein VHL33_01070 [Casimicrobiaceae bacterium]|jgi:hypothetical protein|nr:hypothetical protein [Casimicrobiaceae bacterium]
MPDCTGASGHADARAGYSTKGGRRLRIGFSGARVPATGTGLAIGEGDAGGAGALAAGDRCGARGLRGAITSPRGQSPGA